MRLASWLLLAGTGCHWLADLEHVEVRDARARLRKPITVTQMAASMLVDFPVHVSLLADPDLVRHAPASTDLSFVALDGSPLAFEIVDHDLATGTLDAWVRVPSLVHGVPTRIELRFAPPTIAIPSTQTWSDIHALVWHASTRVSHASDSTANALHAYPASQVSIPVRAPGIAGTAFVFDGDDDELCVASSADEPVELGMSSFSYALWVRRAASSARQYQFPFSKGGTADVLPGFGIAGFTEAGGTMAWYAMLSDGQRRIETGYFTVAADVWTQIVVVLDRDALEARTYRDGQRIHVAPLGNFGSVSGTPSLCLGNQRESLAGYYRGALDEVRVYTGALADGWIAAEYANLAQRDAFVTISPIEAF
jgi:hypothetical protein